MSAYIVDRNHIAFLVSAAMSRRIVSSHGSAFYWRNGNVSRELTCTDRDEATRVGQMLWDECIKSVSHRYDEPKETLPGPVGESYIYEHDTRTWLDFDPVQVLKSISCYEYQSCEHPAWEESEAYEFCQALRSAAIHSLPGYEEAEWGAPEAAPGAMNLSMMIRSKRKAKP